MINRGVTINRYIAIHKEFISYRNMKFVLQYIAIFLLIKLFNFPPNSCLVAIASPEDACLSHVYTYKRSSYSHVYNSESITMIMKGSKLRRILRN